jgi:DNA helicase-2/ATP-dependent DNA helicase PcrA
VNEPSPFHLPSITDDDVAWACALLNLPSTAFAGSDGQDPRIEVLKSTATLDIEACPGSGKTTLLVAKLAILARKWSDRRRGICVLSHTNVARREIEQRLGNTDAGQRLLSYPHFVGTIHGLINEFLAIPWLRSFGYPVRVIDNDHCTQHRRRLLALRQFTALANYVRQREANRQFDLVAQWCVVSPSFAVLKANGAPEFKDPTTPAARQLSLLAEKCVGDGYYRYDEMFMWGHDLIDKMPTICGAIRERFPMLFIDEVQDNSETQSRLLFRLFVEGDTPIIRQRFGDSNQAIYQYSGQTDGATTDQFPDHRVRKDIPNSHRFGQAIANLAMPLAAVPQNLFGGGPPPGLIASETSTKNAVFLFGDQTVVHVIPAYAHYLQNVFSEQELRQATFTTVGAVHRPGDDDKIPRSVGHYCGGSGFLDSRIS